MTVSGVSDCFDKRTSLLEYGIKQDCSKAALALSDATLLKWYLFVIALLAFLASNVANVNAP
jgi:hypothetical protein